MLTMTVETLVYVSILPSLAILRGEETLSMSLVGLILVGIGTASTEAVGIVEIDTAGREEGILHMDVAVGVIHGELDVVDIIVINDELMKS